MDQFTPLIFPGQHRDANISSCRGMMQFMLEYHHNVFRLPTKITAELQHKKMMMESGQIESPSYLKTGDIKCSII